VRVLRLSNNSKHTITLVASDFYMSGVRAVSIEKETLGPHQSTTIYEVTSNA
jgi:hypothetical protein